MTRKPPKDALAVFLLLSFLYFYFAPNPKWNGYSRLDLILAVVHEGRLMIDSFYHTPGTSTGDFASYNGHYYSDKAIGTAVLGTIVYAPMHWATKLAHFNLSPRVACIVITFFVISLPSALAGSLFYLLCAHLSGSKLVAYAATLGYALGTMAFPFSAMLFGHQLAAALLLMAFFLVFRWRDHAVPVPRSQLLLFGFLLGFSIITEFPMAVAVAALGVYYLYVMRSRRLHAALETYLLPAAAGLVPIALQMIYNALCFGSPFSTAYQHLVNPEFQQGMSQGFLGMHLPNLKVLYYLTAHPARGIFWHSPVLVAALVGLAVMVRKREWRAEGLLAAFLTLAFLLMNSGYFLWWGGYSFGPRHLIPMLPFLCLGLAFFPRRAFAVVVVLVMVSVALMIVVTSQDPLPPEAPELTGTKPAFLDYWPVREHIIPFFIEGVLSLNLGRIAGLHGPASVLPAVVVLLAFTAWFCLRYRGQQRTPEAPSAKA